MAHDALEPRATSWAFPLPPAPGCCRPRYRPEFLSALLPLLVALGAGRLDAAALVASALISLGVLGGIATKTGRAPILCRA